MKAERWQQVDQLLQAALERGAGEHGAFLDQACAGDADLRREVESLLAVNMPTNDFLSQPALEVAAGMISATLLDKKDDLPLAQGAVLDNRYRIERELGRGGMGVVFLAKDQKLDNRQVVVKVLLEEQLSAPDKQCIGVWLKQKFKDEKNALARLRHPGIVSPTDAGELPGGQAYLVMEYVPGKSLRKAISPGGMELNRAAGLIHQIAQGLAAAHKENIIHRDLKPENILLLEVDGEEQTRLIDFGIATVRDAMSAGLPHTTHVAGTGAYMAPEQLIGKPEEASDIYALGVIAYELVTGRRPFNAASLTHLDELQREGIKIKPRELRADLPEAAEAAILKALAFNPADRHQDAREFGNQFRQAIEAVDPFQTNFGVLPQEETPVHPDALPTQRLPSRRRFLVPAAALLVALLLGALAWHGLDFGRANDGNNASVNPPVTPPTVAERTLSYSLWLKRAARPRNVEPVLPRDVIGSAGDEFRLNVSSPQAGHLYLINERPTQPQKFDVMFPTVGSAEMRADQVLQIPPPSGRPENDWFGFEREGSADKICLIWSANSVPELEAVKNSLERKDEGEIKNKEQVEALRRYLAAQSANAPTIETDETTKQTKLTGKGPVLIGSITLRHR